MGDCFGNTKPPPLNVFQHKFLDSHAHKKLIVLNTDFVSSFAPLHANLPPSAGAEEPLQMSAPLSSSPMRKPSRRVDILIRKSPSHISSGSRFAAKTIRPDPSFGVGVFIKLSDFNTP